MSERNEFIKALAEGNAEAYAQFDKLPSVLKISYGLAIEEYKRKQADIELGEGYTLHQKEKVSEISDDDLALSISNRLKDSGIKKDILERQKAEEEATKARQQEINEKINGQGE